MSAERTSSIHIRREFDGAPEATIRQWIAEAIAVFAMLSREDGDRIAFAAATIASVGGPGRRIAIDVLLDGVDVEIEVAGVPTPARAGRWRAVVAKRVGSSLPCAS